MIGIKGVETIQKQDFITKVSEVLRDHDVTKSVSVPNTYITILDDKENKRKLPVKIPDRQIAYTKTDIRNIVDACLAVMEDCLRRGEELTFYGFGTMGSKYRAPRMVKKPMTEEWCDIPGHYVPYMKFGAVFQNAVRFYEMVMKESTIDLPDPIYDPGDRPIDPETGDYVEEWED